MSETCETCRSNCRLIRIATGMIFFTMVWRALNGAFFDVPHWTDYIAGVVGAFVGYRVFLSEHQPKDGADHG